MNDTIREALEAIINECHTTIAIEPSTVQKAWDIDLAALHRIVDMAQAVLASSQSEPAAKPDLDWDSIDDAFGSFLSAVSADVPGERYERSSAERGGRWMRHLIMRALRGGDISRTPRLEPRQTAEEVEALIALAVKTGRDYMPNKGAADDWENRFIEEARALLIRKGE